MNMARPESEYILSFDIDWAPDWMIDEVAETLVGYNVKATWFVTHSSPAVNRLHRYNELFELGIHPNMMPGSTHGANEDEVLSHVRELVPDAVSMRTHGLYQSTNFLNKAARDYGIRIDVSLLLPNTPNLIPHILPLQDAQIFRIPYFWEDDVEMHSASPEWELGHGKYRHAGMKIFDFHPIHLALNTETFERYEHLKRLHPVSKWTSGLIARHANPGKGPKSLFHELVVQMKNGGRWIRDLAPAGW